MVLHKLWAIAAEVSPLLVRCSNLVDHEGALRAFQLREVNGNLRLVLARTCSVLFLTTRSDLNLSEDINRSLAHASNTTC
ncbi:hypothetical protein AFLA_007767 [Aspergillus flavus NRRL3357]|nr:hypothetical protein AFLA_007767 [Aspergillus flavus NRRL3357]